MSKHADVFMHSKVKEIIFGGGFSIISTFYMMNVKPAHINRSGPFKALHKQLLPRGLYVYVVIVVFL